MSAGTFERSVADIQRAILREHRAGVDVGELLVAAVTAADRQLGKNYRSVTDNRPGSWEAALVEQMVEPDWAA